MFVLAYMLSVCIPLFIFCFILIYIEHRDEKKEKAALDAMPSSTRRQSEKRIRRHKKRRQSGKRIGRMKIEP
jgi:hypothetical protein